MADPDVRWQQRPAGGSTGIVLADAEETRADPTPARSPASLKTPARLCCRHWPRTRQQVWLYGSRAINLHRPGADLDLSLEGAGLDHHDLLQLMGDVDDPLLAWTVDLSLRHQLPTEPEEHLQRVGRPPSLHAQITETPAKPNQGGHQQYFGIDSRYHDSGVLRSK